MEVSIVVPTKNEQENIATLLKEIEEVSKNEPKFKYEVIVVDDSDTPETVQIANEIGAVVMFGQGKGLGQAILDGIRYSNNDIILVMDADLSHNPHAIPELLEPFEQGYDMTIGSRYVKGGGTVGWELSRRLISRFACLLALPVTTIKDATSGFFAIRKSLIEDVKLEASSWKIMLEILLKAKPVRVKEIPIEFVVRQKGKSKFNQKQVLAYLKHIVLLALWKYQKFIKFCIVGGTGALITFGITWLLTEVAGFWYMASLMIAVIIATVSNFTFNTIWTYRLEKSPKEADYEWNAFYKGNIIQKWWKQSIAKTIWDWIPSSKKILDVGCGSSPIITKYGKSAVGIDVNDEKITFMQHKYPLATFLSGGTINTNGKFNHIICIEVLEHLNEPEKMVEEISRLLDDGSIAVFATPDYSKPLWKVAEIFTPYKEEHVVQFTKQSLEDMCKRYGLKPLKHKYIATCDLVEMFVKE